MKARLVVALCFLAVVTFTLSVPAGVTAQPAVLGNFSSQQLGLGVERQVSTALNPEMDRHMPATAYDSANRQTLVVWHRNNGSNLYAIEGRLLNDAGVPLGGGPTVFVQGGTPVYQPAVAYNAYDHQYLVVWMRNTLLDGKTYAIWGMILNANLTVAHAEFAIFNPLTNYSCWTPRVAWNVKNTEYQVVWTAYNIAGWPIMYPENISEETLQFNGNLVGHILVIGNTPDNMIYPSQVDLVYANDFGGAGQYMWVWSQVKPGTADHDIWGANIDAALGGYIPGLPPFPIDTSNTDQAYPRIATNGNNHFLVVWQERDAFHLDWDIRGREINQTGVTFGDVHVIAGYGSTDETDPFVCGWPGATMHYAVGYVRESETGQGIWLAYNNNGANVLNASNYNFWMDNFPAADYGFWYNTYPTGVVAGLRLQLAYEGISDSPTDHKQIYSLTWTPYLGYIPVVRK